MHNILLQATPAQQIVGQSLGGLIPKANAILKQYKPAKPRK